jgi:hypothetical protein
MARPQVDERRLREYGQRLLGDVAGRVLEDELIRGLNRVFGGAR